jgi:hypothetical protein
VTGQERALAVIIGSAFMKWGWAVFPAPFCFDGRYLCS